MARTKYSERSCSYCNKLTRMEMVGEMEGVSGKMWFRCTRCHHTSLIVVDPASLNHNTGKLDATNATLYNPLQNYTVGETIFHSEWNDLGRVLSKTKTSDGSQSILVSFEKQGQRRLIENLKPDLLVEAVTV